MSQNTRQFRLFFLPELVITFRDSAVMAGWAPSLYAPVYAEKPQLEKDIPSD